MSDERIRSETVEFLRFGSDRGLVAPEHEYLRTRGFDQLVETVRPSVDHGDLLRQLHQLRYVGTAGAAEEAAQTLAAEANRFLPAVPAGTAGLTQVDVVTKASELWVVPFEAGYAEHPDWLADEDSGVVVTRRIRGGFSEQALPWPDRPRVLFAHAPAAADLSQDLIGEHAAALREALAPWSGGRDDDTLLRVLEVASTGQLTRARAAFEPSYIHLLAHGARCATDPAAPHEQSWGLRLGYPGEDGIPPPEIADVLGPQDGVPLVVTLAACDSANAADVFNPSRSVAQELHRRGIPIVVGSQLPLTKAGSVTFARAFYRRLLCGQDVRQALHAGRVAVHRDPQARHDWLSLVGYVRLPPEGYGQYLVEFGLRAELGMLDAQQRRADALSLDGGTPAAFDAVEVQLRDRIRSLERRQEALGRRRPDLLDECGGLLASAHKRLAELLFRRATLSPRDSGDDLRSSREALGRALEYYRVTHHRNINSHWVGIQALALEAALYGEFRHPDDWQIVHRAAELARDADPADVWACGTLAEVWLLAAVRSRGTDLEKAGEAVQQLLQRSRTHRSGRFARASTRRQIHRYITWWTHDHGFFPGAPDLASPARELVAMLDTTEES